MRKIYDAVLIKKQRKDHINREIIGFILCCLVMGVFMYLFFNLTGGFQC